MGNICLFVMVTLMVMIVAMTAGAILAMAVVMLCIGAEALLNVLDMSFVHVLVVWLETLGGFYILP